MIDQATVNRILDAANILEVVSDFVSLRRRGVNYVGLCPFHDEKTPSFSVSPSKGICKCFSCGKGGSAVHFIMEHEQMSYYEALKYLAKKYNIEVQERELSDEEKKAQGDRESMLILNTFAQEYFSSLLFNHIDGKSIGMAYFRERGFRDDIIQKFKLGYALEQRDAFATEALKAGYKKEYLLKTGLCLESQTGQMNDRFRGRVIFPVFSLSGKVIAFGGRVLKKTDKTAKYVNSPESEVYHKSNELYGIFQAKQAIVKNDKCFLVEGYTDVLSMHQAGIENVVASSGTSLTTGQIRLIHRFTDNITVLYDGDSAGIKASLRGIDLILKEGMNIKVVLLPDGDDPDSFSKKQSAASFTEYINSHETDFIRFKTNLLLESAGEDPIQRASLISDTVQSIAIIPDTIVRSVYIKECSRLLDVDEQVLIKEVNKTRYRQIQKEKEEITPLPPGQESETINEAIAQKIQTAQPSDSSLKEDSPAQPAPSSPFDRYERTLIRYVVRYGEDVLFTATEEEGQEPVQYRVATYIEKELQGDDISLQNTLYAQILKEACQHISSEEHFCCERYFISHPENPVSQLAVDLVSEKYQLSKYHSKFQKIETEREQLFHLVPRAIFELKDAIIKQERKRLNEQLKKASSENDFEKILQTMGEIAQLDEIKAILAKELGERIIIKPNI